VIGLLPPPVPNRAEHPFVGQVRVAGLLINVENEHGSFRQGVDPYGKPWRVRMVAGHYGEIARTDGADGEPVDVYVGPVEPDLVYLVRQLDPHTGEFDEVKVMLGYRSSVEARGAYENQYDGPGYYGGMWVMLPEQFRTWLRTGAPTPNRPMMKDRVMVRANISA